MVLPHPSPVNAAGLRLPSLGAAMAGFSQESTQLIISTNNSREAKYSLDLDLLLRYDFMSEEAEMGEKTREH